MRSRLSRRAREINCSMANGVLESADIRLAGFSRRGSADMTPFCDSGSKALPRQPPRSTFVRRSTPFGNVDRRTIAGVPAAGRGGLLVAGVESKFRKFLARLRALPDGTNFPAPLLSTVRGCSASLAFDTQPRRHPHSPLIAYHDCRRPRGRAAWPEDDFE